MLSQPRGGEEVIRASKVILQKQRGREKSKYGGWIMDGKRCIFHLTYLSASSSVGMFLLFSVSLPPDTLRSSLTLRRVLASERVLPKKKAF